MSLLEVLTVAVVVGSALVGGIFFAFSTFVMRALARVPANQGIAAMQAINVTVLTPLFFLAFFGTGILCVAVVFLSIGTTAGVHLVYVLTGGGLYVVGCLGVTMAFNVPLNNRLARVDPETAEARILWGHYLTRWTLWNHVRTIASLVAAVLFVMSVVYCSHL